MFESKQNISPSPRLSKPANSESANSANSANSATEATEAPSFPHARTHYFASVSPRCCFLINPSIRNPTNDGGVALSSTDTPQVATLHTDLLEAQARPSLHAQVYMSDASKTTMSNAGPAAGSAADPEVDGKATPPKPRATNDEEPRTVT